MHKTIFHQDWWLDAVCPGAWSEVEVKCDGKATASWRFVEGRRFGRTHSELPPFTRFLDPVLLVQDAQENHRRLDHVMGALFDALPRFDYFQTGLGPGWGDVLIFMRNGFGVKVHQTLVVDGAKGAEAAFAGLAKKTRSDVRRAKSRFTVEEERDPERFAAFYRQNLAGQGRRNVFDFDVFADLFEACRARDAGHVLGAYDETGKQRAATFTVWDDRRAYQLLATNDQETGSLASSLLTWANLEHACNRGQIFDFDGVTSQARLKFLSHFGGAAENRFLIERGFPMHRLGSVLKAGLSQHIKAGRHFTGDASRGGV
jgi:hypothetical protein